MSIPCDHIALWKVGASKAKVVPGSGTHAANYVALVPAPGGRLWILWYDTALNEIRVARTNAAATRLGSVHTIAAPSKTLQFFALQAEGSIGPVDLLALVNTGSSVAYWHAQLLPRLNVTSSRTTVSHRKATTVTFTVTDVGDPVAGATVKLLGKSQTTNSTGVAKITVPARTATGKHTATASKADYSSGTVSVKVR